MHFPIALSLTGRRSVSGRVTCAFSLVLLLSGGGVGAEPPASGTKPAAGEQQTDRNVGEQPASEDAAIAELRDKREKAQTELNAVSRPGALSKGAPPDVTQKELQERRSLLEQVVRGYDEQLNDYLRLAEARQRHAEINRTSTEWTGFAEPQPYSVAMADQLWDAAYAFRLASDGLQSQLNLLTLRFDRARASLTSAEERLRQSSEKLEAATDSTQAARLRWLRDIDDLRKRAAAVQVSAAELSKTRVEEELADARARLAFAERQLETVDPHTEFSEDDLNKVRARLSQERQSLEQELERTIIERRTQAQTVQDAERQLRTQLTRQTKRGKPEQETPDVSQAKAAVDIARAGMDNLVLKGDLLQQIIDIVEGERQLWESRYAIRHSDEPGFAREAYNRFTPLSTHFRASRDYLRQQIGIVSGQLSELDNRLQNTTGTKRRPVEALLRAFRQREDAYNRALQRVEQAARFLERWKSEFKEQQKELPLSARLEDWLTHAGNHVKTVWTFEVFAAEDTIEVDGKKITGSRSVTVGKILSALLILLIGYVICLYVGRLIGRLAVARFGMAPDVANLVRQWSQAVLITILIVVSFMSVKIPLTIFAFLGGAFAIGVGFGAQNLLKNIISGILVLIERPLRVGDLIEVDNVRGRVTSIGLRSSTVRDTKGMETLIPNSSFLERHLTNWTYSSRISRFSLRVGAPYGSSPQQVMDLLADLAHQHPQVLKIPKPQVLLDEFGAQARIFTLNYWLEIRLDLDPNQVASELRFSIEQKFEEIGLKVLPAA